MTGSKGKTRQDKAKKLEWYAYRHVNGTIHLKRYFDYGDIRECSCSPFVVATTGPFECNTRDQALEIMKARLGE